MISLSRHLRNVFRSATIIVMQYQGLTSKEAAELLKSLGPNEIPEQTQTRLKKFLKWVISPIALMLLLAALLSLFSGKVFDFFFILVLMVLNALIGFWQENKADNAIKELNKNLISQTSVFRDGKWQLVDSRFLVKGDLIECNVGSVVPADGEIVEAKNLSINESAITGESLPKEKKTGEKAFSGSYISTGLARIKIIATGKETYFGKTLFSIDQTPKKSSLEQDILRISKFLSILSGVAVVILTITFLFQKTKLSDLLTLDLSLVIAGIPISLPTVMTLIIEFGVIELAKKQVIVRRLSALEDLANVNLLLTDKTGTLTKNKIAVNQTIVYNKTDEKQLLHYATFASSTDQRNVINQAILEKATELGITIDSKLIVDFTPADSNRKRSTAVVKHQDGMLTISVGAPQVIESLCSIPSSLKEKFDADVESLAKNGFRALAVAIHSGTDEKDMEPLGLISLSDTLRDDAKSVISFMQHNGIGVIMVTGDHQAISQQVALSLGLTGKVLSKSDLEKIGWEKINKSIFQEVSVFSEILPDDKYHLVKTAKHYFIVASNGDGVNDLPAIKAAQVGMAVKTAVDALKSTADIVLLTDGISVIRDAIIESRKIFSRLYSYSTYRISESLRLIITITVLGLLYRFYPLTPLQLILLAVLNDVPIISLAFDRVKIATQPSRVDVKARFILSSLFGLTGVAESLILFFIMANWAHLPLGMIQTAYFLKLTVSGHMLIFVARTTEKWFKFLPSKQVILATTITQSIATLLALTGFLMPAAIPLTWVIVVWAWAFIWMQISEAVKQIRQRSISN